MSQNANISCQCGKVRGQVRDVSGDTVNRVLCFCEDCQAFLHFLKRAELLDEHGGTDIVQVAPCAVKFEQGTEHIIGVRLTPRGLYRWYTSCCNTPLGNTMTPSLPFVGMISALFSEVPSAGDKLALLGEVRGMSFGKHAVGEAPSGSTKPNLKLLFRMLGVFIGWKLRSKAWPHPFFDRASKKPAYPVTTLEPKEREALRGPCGPNPAA